MGLRANTSALLQRLSLAVTAGLRFDGNRDYYQIFGYKRLLTFADFAQKYKRQDIAKRIIDAPISATWRNPPEILIENKTKKKQFDKIWKEIVAQHRIWKQLERVDKLAGLGNYAILLVGVSDGAGMDKPIRKKDSNELLYLQPYAQINAEVKELDSDPTSSRFGMPKIYKITIQNPTSTLGDTVSTTASQLTVKAEQFEVHYSRIVHVAEDLLENNWLGQPRLEAVFNLLDDLLKVAGGTSETFWLTANRGMQADVDKDSELSAGDAEALADELEEYQHQLRRWIRTKGVKINTLGSDVPNPKETFDMLIALISGATGIPRRILTGSEAGQLASDQDRANWADRINERRNNHAEPNMLTPLLLQLSDAGILPELTPGSIDYKWPPNFQMTPLENAQMMAQKARAASNLARHFNEHPVMTESEAREIMDLDKEVPAEVLQAIEELGRAELSPQQPDPADQGENDPDEANARPGQSNGTQE